MERRNVTKSSGLHKSASSGVSWLRATMEDQAFVKNLSTMATEAKTTHPIEGCSKLGKASTGPSTIAIGRCQRGRAA